MLFTSEKPRYSALGMALKCWDAISLIGSFLSSQDPLGTANADNAFTLYYVKFRAAAPKVRVLYVLVQNVFTFHGALQTKLVGRI